MANTNGTNGVNGHTNGHTEYPALVESASDFLTTDFDFVVIGGGTAGLAVAARLTENPDVHVGVLERGKSRLGDPLVDTPALFTKLLGNSEYDYNMMTEPQTGGKRHHMPRGKALGGSSAINYMMYVRGSDADYDDWATLVKDDAWSSRHMKQYMRKHQTLEPIDPSIVDRSTMPFVGEHHGTSGPCRTSFNTSTLPIEDAIIKACDQVSGYNKKPTDPWSGDHIGFFNTLGLVARSGPNKGKRSYAARGYFATMSAHRPNLKVLCEAQVERIVLDGNSATGVVFTHSGQQHTVNVKREVVVAGGVIHSPQILELSGIGDPKVLNAAGVECKIENLAVGNNFNDHVVSGLGYELKPGVMSLDAIYLPGALEAVQKEYMEKQTGGLSHISSCQGFFPYKMVAAEGELAKTVQSIRDAPDATPFHKKQNEQIITHLQSDTSANLQLVVLSATVDTAIMQEDQGKAFPAPAQPGTTPMGCFFACCLQYPVSRGSCHIKSSDASEHPTIDPAYFKHEADAAVMAGGIQFLDRVAQSPLLKDIFAKRTHPAPELDLQDVEVAKREASTFYIGEYHPCGTLSMGEAVDSRLRVKGAQNIRVVDASVFPNHVSGNIVSSVYMVAEKAADILKEDWDYAALAMRKGAKIGKDGLLYDPPTQLKKVDSHH